MNEFAIVVLLTINVLLTAFCAYALGFALLTRLDQGSPHYRMAARYVKTLYAALVMGGLFVGGTFAVWGVILAMNLVIGLFGSQ
jgi:hypothetical protein